MFDSITFVQNVEALRTLENGNYLLLIGEKTDLSTLTNAKSMHYFGAIFPQIIYRDRTYEEGIIAAKLSSKTRVTCVPMDDLSGLKIRKTTHTIITFIDGYSIYTDTFLEKLYARTPEATHIVGGGAGSTLNTWNSPAFFADDAFYTNHALVISSAETMGIGVQHGLKNAMGPFIATHSSGHMLEKINFQNAYDVYRSVIEKISSFRFDSMPFFTIAQHFPLGIVRYNKDIIIREPISTNEQAIILNAHIDANSVISILEAKPDELMQAAITAAKEAYLPDTKSLLVIECLSRYGLLQEQFSHELRAIANLYEDTVPLWGVLSLGEIANTNQEGIEFYNNTCVIGTLCSSSKRS